MLDRSRAEPCGDFISVIPSGVYSEGPVQVVVKLLAMLQALCSLP
jgi:hypothetical protein